MTDKIDIIGMAERFRDFKMIPGNTYTPDVTEKIAYAQALMIAVEALRIIEDDIGMKDEHEAVANRQIAKEALSRIKSL